MGFADRCGSPRIIRAPREFSSTEQKQSFEKRCRAVRLCRQKAISNETGGLSAQAFRVGRISNRPDGLSYPKSSL
jgi:hypothetical protein